MSIDNFAKKIKGVALGFKKRDLWSFMVIILVAFGSFYLGQISTTNSSNSQVTVLGARGYENQLDQLNLVNNTNATNLNSNQGLVNQAINDNSGNYAKGNYLASSRGKKYYPIDCPAANNIKMENRIYFKTASEAENKGYTLSSSCN